MQDEMNQATITAEDPALSGLEIDTIGEILNISMGSAATAISTMLDQQVLISTPKVEVRGFSTVDYVSLEPAMLVKIRYVEGIVGSNVMVFRQRDMQVILGLLMGSDEEPSDEFIFDELSISAACEVMNQMMGSSATALSDFLGRPINISTPEPVVVDNNETYEKTMEVREGEEVVSVSFRLTIEGVMDSDFVSILTIDLAKDIIGQAMNEQEAPEPEPVQQPVQPQMPEYPPAAEYTQPPQMAPQVPQAPQYGMPPMPQAPQYADPSLAQQQYAAQQYAAQPYAAPQMPYMAPNAAVPPGYGVDPFAAQPAVMKQPVNVQDTQFPQFSPQQTGNPASGSNMDLLMRVALDVSVVIGKTKRKIKDIIEFGQGTVIELNKQAGAPVDIVVNGCLLARGDVVVIDDNFGVRVTEIVGSRELLESLKEENGL